MGERFTPQTPLAPAPVQKVESAKNKREAVEQLKMDDPAILEKLSKILGINVADIDVEEFEGYKKYVAEVKDLIEKHPKNAWLVHGGYQRWEMKNGDIVFVNADGTFSLKEGNLN